MTIDPPIGVTILAPNASWALLRSAEVARLAVLIDHHPDIFPINYIVDHGSVVFRTTEGTKLVAAVASVGVAIEIDGYDAGSGEAWSVVIKGDALEIKEANDLFDALYVPLFPWDAASKHRFVRIVPTELTGRRFNVVDRTAWSTPASAAVRHSRVTGARP